MMKMVCVRVRARDLRPGDLFSTRGPEYWDEAVNGVREPAAPFAEMAYPSVGEKVYVRTNAKLTEDQMEIAGGDDLVYRLEVVTDHE